MFFESVLNAKYTLNIQCFVTLGCTYWLDTDVNVDNPHCHTKKLKKNYKIVCLGSYANDLAIITNNIKHIQPQLNKIDLFILAIYGPMYKQMHTVGY